MSKPKSKSKKSLERTKKSLVEAKTGTETETETLLNKIYKLKEKSHDKKEILT